MINIEQTIKLEAKNIFEEVLAIRKHLHQNPELSFQEFETTKYLQQKLISWGIEIDSIWTKTGFTVLLDSGRPGKTIALRSDLDALPIIEQNEVEYKSKNTGIMHACGHDVHSSCLAGVAKILNENKNIWNGKVLLIFQAGEEKLPGGASLMIKEGLLEKYQPDMILAQHVYPELEAGEVGFKEGMYMASADEIYLTVEGKGGHGALPHNNIDPIIAAANILLGLQTLSSRVAPPTIPTVLSFGKIEGLGATNVIPGKVNIEGTLRTMDEHWRVIYHQKITEIAQEIGKAHGANCIVDIRKGYPFLVNDIKTTQSSQSFAKKFLGEDKVSELPLRMTAEDFAYFSQKAPSCFYRLGVGNKSKGIIHSVHHSRFDIDESSLETAIGLMTYLTVSHSL
jgi:amidohydrolase